MNKYFFFTFQNDVFAVLWSLNMQKFMPRLFFLFFPFPKKDAEKKPTSSTVSSLFPLQKNTLWYSLKYPRSCFRVLGVFPDFWGNFAERVAQEKVVQMTSVHSPEDFSTIFDGTIRWWEGEKYSFFIVYLLFIYSFDVFSYFCKTKMQKCSIFRKLK